MKYLILCLLSITLYQNTAAQINCQKADLHKEKSKKSLEKGDFLPSEKYFDLAKSGYETCDDLLGWLKLYKEIGNIYSDQYHNYEKAIGLYDYAIENPFRTPTLTDEKKEIAWLYFWKGYASKEQNKQHAAIKDFEKGIDIYLEGNNGIEDYNIARYFYSQLGNAYDRIGDCDKAAYYHDRRRGILLRLQEWSVAAGAYYDLAIGYMKNEEYGKAIDSLLAGLKLPNLDPEREYNLLNDLGLAYILDGQFKEGIEATKACEEVVYRNYSPEDHIYFEVDINDNYARYYQGIQKFDDANYYRDLALTQLTAVDPNNKRQYLVMIVSKANLYLEWSKPIEALGYYQTALKSLIVDIDPDPYALPISSQLYADPMLIDLLEGKAKAFLMLYRTKSDPSFFEKHLSAQDLIKEVESLLLQLYFLEGSKLCALKKLRNTKEELLEQLFEELPGNTAYRLEERMFNISERSRATLLLEGTRLGDLITEDIVDDKLRVKYEFLSLRIIDCTNQIIKSTGNNSNQKDSLEAILLNLRRERSAILNQIKDLLPVVYQEDPINLVENISSSLGKDQSFVEFFLGQEFLYLFIITSESSKVHIKRVPWSEEWSQKVASISAAIKASNQEDEFYVNPALELHSHLFDSIYAVTNDKRLILIPDAELWSIPFNALLTEPIKESIYTRYKEYPYLIRKKSLSFGFSGRMYLQMDRKVKRKNKLNLLGIAPSYFNGSSKRSNPQTASRKDLVDLKYNNEEVLEILDLFNGSLSNSDTATKSQFLKLYPIFNIFHFAVHAVPNYENLMNGYLAFSNIPDNSKGEFELYAHEISNLRFNDGLVVLSACETGVGKFSRGEGVNSIARAFAMGGAASIISSKWLVNDESTKKLMVLLYKELEKGKNLDLALQNAQLKYLKTVNNQTSARPFFWAAFSVIGDSDPVSYDLWDQIKWLVLAVTLALLIVLIIKKMKG